MQSHREEIEEWKQLEFPYLSDSRMASGNCDQKGYPLETNKKKGSLSKANKLFYFRWGSNNAERRNCIERTQEMSR